jgi:thiol-disulfide isomerase/thioredoxin
VITRRRALLLWASAAGWPAAALQAGQPPALAAQSDAGLAAPALRWPALTRLDGQPWTVPLAADGRPCAVVAVIWSTTCPFCRRHNAHVEKLHRAAAGRALAVVTAATDRDTRLVEPYLNDSGYTFPVVREHDRLRSLFTERRVIPFTATVGRDGRVRERLPGEMFEEDVLGFLKLAT